MGKLSTKHKKVLEKYIDTVNSENPSGDWNKAVQEVYGYDPNDKNFSDKCYQLRRRIENKEEVAEIFAMANVNMPRLASKIDEWLDAKKKIIWQGEIAKDEKGNDIEVPDYKTQQTAWDYAEKMINKNRKKNSNVNLQSMNLVVTVENPEQAKQTAKQINQEDYEVE